MGNPYDIVIIGGGPAGLTAGLYASRARMKTLLLEKALYGGQLLITDRIENFPGFPKGAKGPELAEWMRAQAESFGLETRIAEAGAITAKKGGGTLTVGLDGEGRVEALAVIIATGARWNTLNIPGEKEFAGRGVSYCATCDGPLFRNKKVIVVGGGDTAIEDALFLTRFAEKVTIVHRRDRLRATKILQERALANKKIEFCFNSAASEIVGDRKFSALRVRDSNTAKESELSADGVFILIGVTPNSEIVKGLVKVDDKGYVICDDDMATSVDGVFACGDVRKKLLRQVVTAVGDGATAAFSAQHHVERLKGTGYPA